jgi:CRP/FNR family transcriptional regulator, anaerobic regulatory protein
MLICKAPTVALVALVAPAVPLRQQAEACCLCPLGSSCAAGTPQPAFARRMLRAGAMLYQAGDPFRLLHAVRCGTFKASVSMPDGREQVAGFHMAGDLVGLDGVADGRHRATVVALEDTQSCVIDYAELLALSASAPPLQHALHRLMSREIARGRWHMLLLGSMSALERLAAFLIDLSQRASDGGGSGRDLRLRMTRRELGSYLGLTLETVSRSLTTLRDLQHLEVDNRDIRIRDLPRFLRVFQARKVGRPRVHPTRIHNSRGTEHEQGPARQQGSEEAQEGPCAQPAGPAGQPGAGGRQRAQAEEALGPRTRGQGGVPNRRRPPAHPAWPSCTHPRQPSAHC